MRVVYFLVNNNYHLDFVLKLTKQLHGFEFRLIKVPYVLNAAPLDPCFSRAYSFTDTIPFSLIKFITRPDQIFGLQRNIRMDLSPASNDVLFVHTEMDFVNQYITQIFHQRGAKVFLLEDGTATMSDYNLVPERAPLKAKLKTLILKYIYGFKFSKVARYGSEVLPVMKDSIFNGVVVNYGTGLKRDIPFFKLKESIEPFEIIHQEGAIFFNSPYYLWHTSEAEYVTFLKEILHISTNFTPFFFKFHPSDSQDVRVAITNFIESYFKNIEILTEEIYAEKIIETYPVQYAITFNSTAALNLISKGITPIFLNEHYNQKYPNASLIAFSGFLKSINCNVPKSMDEVKPGFSAFDGDFDTETRYSIQEILNDR